MLERFEVQRRKGFVLITRVGATVLAFDFAEHADDRAWIACLALSDGRLVSHRRGPDPLVEPSRQPVEIQKASQTHGRILGSRTLSHPTANRMRQRPRTRTELLARQRLNRIDLQAALAMSPGRLQKGPRHGQDEKGQEDADDPPQQAP
jgi:hypothetical protein